MKRVVLCTAVMLISGSLFAADSKEEIQNAAKALAEKDNYSWTSSSDVKRGENSFQFETSGMLEKEGFTHLTIPRDNNTIEIVMKGDKGAVRTPEGWSSFAEIRSAGDAENRGRFLARMIQNFKAPATEVEDLLSKVEELKPEGDAFVGQLTEDGAEELLSFGRGPGGAAVQARDAKGMVKFWVKDGVVTKYSYDVEGTVTVNGNPSDVQRKIEVEVRDIDSTKVVIPDEARSKAS